MSTVCKTILTTVQRGRVTESRYSRYMLEKVRDLHAFMGYLDVTSPFKEEAPIWLLCLDLDSLEQEQNGH